MAKSFSLDLTPEKISGPKNSLTKIMAEGEAGETIQREIPVFDDFLMLEGEYLNLVELTEHLSILSSTVFVLLSDLAIKFVYR